MMSVSLCAFCMDAATPMGPSDSLPISLHWNSYACLSDPLIYPSGSSLKSKLSPYNFNWTQSNSQVHRVPQFLFIFSRFLLLQAVVLCWISTELLYFLTSLVGLFAACFLSVLLELLCACSTAEALIVIFGLLAFEFWSVLNAILIYRTGFYFFYFLYDLIPSVSILQLLLLLLLLFGIKQVETEFSKFSGDFMFSNLCWFSSQARTIYEYSLRSLIPWVSSFHFSGWVFEISIFWVCSLFSVGFCYVLV